VSGSRSGADHRAAQLVQHQPRRLIAADAQLAPELHGGDAGLMGGHQIGRQNHTRSDVLVTCITVPAVTDV
jgi:hypothetical protein